MSKYQKQVRIRPVVTGLFSKPRYHFECRDWYGVVGIGPSIPSAWADYVAESLGEAHDRLFNDVLFAGSVGSVVQPIKSAIEFNKLYKQEPVPYLPVVNQHKHAYFDTDGNVMVDKLIDAIFQLQINHETSFCTKPEKLYLS